MDEHGYFLDTPCEPGFASLDKALEGGLRPGSLWGFLATTQKPGPVWDHEKKTINCLNPPRGPLEMNAVMEAYRNGWTLILVNDFGDITRRTA